MKRIYFLLIAVIFINYTFAQNASTLSILGEAKKMVTPDVAVIQINLSAKDKTQAGSYNNLVTKSNDVLTKLKQFGFDEKQIKLSQFSITPEYKYDNGSNNLVGYNGTQHFTVKFFMDKEKIFSIYEKLTDNSATSEISVNLNIECSDELKSKTQNELIEAAIDDAKTKANIIARKANYTLGKILKIGYKYFNVDYTDNINNLSEEPISKIGRGLDDVVVVGYGISQNKAVIGKYGTNAEHFSINEIEFKEEVRIIYGIENN